MSVAEHLKLVVCTTDPDQLYDLSTDRRELVDLAHDPRWAENLSELRTALLADRDLDQLRGRVLASQQRRRFVVEALSRGAAAAWDHRTADDSGSRYVRGDFWSALSRGRLAGPSDRPEDDEATRLAG